MKVNFLGLKGNRQDHQNWALEIVTETDFERSFIQALFACDRFPTNERQMMPVAALLDTTENGLSVMVSAENFCESPLAVARRRIIELEKILDVDNVK